MLLKLVAVTLIITGLIIESEAKAIKSEGQSLISWVKPEVNGRETAIGDINNSLPDVSLTKAMGLFPLSVTGSDGKLTGFNVARNLTPWDLVSGDNTATISQLIKMPNLIADYTSLTQMGLLNANGNMVANLSDSVIKMALTATGGSNSTCTLQIQMFIETLTTTLNTSNMGLVGVLLQVVKSLVPDLTTTVNSTLKPVLQGLLSLLVGEQLASQLLDLALCQAIVNATQNVMPNPNMFNAQVTPHGKFHKK